jgi:hypothetical protein
MQDLNPFDDHNGNRHDRLGRQKPACEAGTFVIVRMRRDAAMCRLLWITFGPSRLPRNSLGLVATVPGSGMVVQRMDEARRQEIGDQRSNDPNALSRNHHPDPGPKLTEIPHPYYAPAPWKWEVQMQLSCRNSQKFQRHPLLERPFVAAATQSPRSVVPRRIANRVRVARRSA